MGWDPVAKWSFQVTRQSGHLGRYGTGTLANLSGQVALIPIDAYRPLNLLVPTSAFLCGVCIERGTRQANTLAIFRMCDSRQLVTFEQVSVSP